MLPRFQDSLADKEKSCLNHSLALSILISEVELELDQLITDKDENTDECRYGLPKVNVIGK